MQSHEKPKAPDEAAYPVAAPVASKRWPVLVTAVLALALLGGASMWSKQRQSAQALVQQDKSKRATQPDAKLVPMALSPSHALVPASVALVPAHAMVPEPAALTPAHDPAPPSK